MGPDPLQLRLGHDLHYTWQEPLPEGGKRIVIATDRYISFQEARNQPRISDYPFTFFEIRVDKAGAGQGKVGSPPRSRGTRRRTYWSSRTTTPSRCA